MSFSYTPLWKLLKKEQLSKTEFAKLVGISNATLAKFSKDQTVAFSIIDRICNYFDCKIEDIILHIPDRMEYLTNSSISYKKASIVTAYPTLTLAQKKLLEEAPEEYSAFYIPELYVVLSIENRFSSSQTFNSCSKKIFETRTMLVPLVSITTKNPWQLKVIDVPLKNGSFNGYIELSEITWVKTSQIVSIEGHLPDCYMQKINTLLDTIEEFNSFEYK